MEDGNEKEGEIEHRVRDNQALTEPMADVAFDGTEDSKDQEQDGVFCGEDRNTVDDVFIIGELSVLVDVCVILGIRSDMQDSLSSGIGHANSKDSTCGCHHRECQ